MIVILHIELKNKKARRRLGVVFCLFQFMGDRNIFVHTFFLFLPHLLGKDLEELLLKVASGEGTYITCFLL